MSKKVTQTALMMALGQVGQPGRGAVNEGYSMGMHPRRRALTSLPPGTRHGSPTPPESGRGGGSGAIAGPMVKGALPCRCDRRRDGWCHVSHLVLTDDG